MVHFITIIEDGIMLDYIYSTNFTKLSGSVNGRSSYQAHLYGGYFGIWWCGSVWIIGLYSEIGQCKGYVYSINTEDCVHNVGWDWMYYNGFAFVEAGEGLG